VTTTDEAVVQEMEEYLTTVQTARPGLSVSHVMQFIREGRLEVRKLGRDGSVCACTDPHPAPTCVPSQGGWHWRRWRGRVRIASRQGPSVVRPAPRYCIVGMTGARRCR
jgi:hypothetical protein